MPSSTQSLVAASTALPAISNLLMVSPQNTVGYQPGKPTSAAGVIDPFGNTNTALPPPPILFHYEGEQDVVSETDITDHYIEDNTAIQNNIALKPIIVSTHGFIGELNNVPPAALALLQTAANKLTAIGAYQPKLSITAQNAYNEAFFAYQTAASVVNSLISSWSSISNSISGAGGQSVIGSNGLVVAANQNLQQTYFQQFYYYQQQRIMFTVQTPWAVFQNMYIWKLRPVQDADTNVITDFNVTFKMIRTASVTGGPLANSSQVSSSGQYSTQSAPTNNVGTSTPPSDISLSTGASNMGVTGVQ